MMLDQPSSVNPLKSQSKAANARSDLLYVTVAVKRMCFLLYYFLCARDYQDTLLLKLHIFWRSPL